MWKQLLSNRPLIILASLMAGVAPGSLAAQILPGGCPTCQQPTATCNCMAQQPIVETQMVPRQTTIMKNEVVTQYRQEAFTQMVPVTQYRQVVVDEGHYQQVWVPKPVTKQVPQVVHQPRTAYRNVPCQVTRQVPQVVTQMVPQQVVRYQPFAYQTQIAPACATGQCLTGQCNTCDTAMIPAMPIAQPTCSSPNPVTMFNPAAAASTGPQSFAAKQNEVEPKGSNPVPDPKFLDSPGAAKDSWTTVTSRRGTSSAVASDDTKTSNSSGIRFKPVRTVHRSWESQTQISASTSDESRQ